MYPLIKRIFDLIFSSLLVLAASPILLPVMLTLKFTGEGDVFYIQERIGKNRNPFGMIKFATMLKDSLNMGNKTITVKNDPRITPFGQILRKTKVNEIPQIFNVLSGSMSLIGPRPLLKKSFEKYNVIDQNVISQMTPGITGLGSLIFNNEEKLIVCCKQNGLDPMEYYKTEIYPYKGNLESWYFENQSFKLDLAIGFLTFYHVIFSNSSLVFKLIKGIPEKPKNLSIEGIQELSKHKK